MPDLKVNYDYASIVRNSEKIAWTVDEVMPTGTDLDFSRNFLPQALAPTNRISCLNDDEKLKLNQIAGNAYVNLFAFVEEYIIATACKHAEAEVEFVVEPDCVTNDFAWIAVPEIEGAGGFQNASMAAMAQVDHLSSPNVEGAFFRDLGSGHGRLSGFRP